MLCHCTHKLRTPSSRRLSRLSKMKVRKPELSVFQFSMDSLGTFWDALKPNLKKVWFLFFTFLKYFGIPEKMFPDTVKRFASVT